MIIRKPQVHTDRDNRPINNLVRIKDTMVQHLEQARILPRGTRLLEVGRMQMYPRIKIDLKQVLDAQAIIARLAVLKVD